MNRFYKKALAVLALLGCVALTGCSLKDKLSGTSGPKAISRPAVESAEVQFTHPAAGDTIAVFDTSAGVFKAVLFPTLAPQACDNFIGLAQNVNYILIIHGNENRYGILRWHTVKVCNNLLNVYTSIIVFFY